MKSCNKFICIGLILSLIADLCFIFIVYDAAGRYGSQFFFGNDYWLGSYSLCTELTNKETNVEVPPFETYFYVAKVRININRKLTPVVS